MTGDKSHGFPKVNRLLKQKEFDKVYQEGKSYHNDYVYLYFYEKDQPPPRLGLSVGKEVGKAYRRNKIKRNIREVFRRNKDAFNNMDIIIRPTSKIAELTEKRMVNEIISSLRKVARGDIDAQE